MNYVRTFLWMLFAVVATYTAAEWAVSHKATAGPGSAILLMQHVPKKTVEQDVAKILPGGDNTPQNVSDAAPPIQPIDVESAYEATIRKYVDKHCADVQRLALEVQRIERHMRILHELQADQDGRLELVRQP